VGEASVRSNSTCRGGNRRGDRNAGGAAEQNVERRSVECRHIVATTGTTTGATRRVADSAFAGSAAEHERSVDAAGNRFSS